MSMHIKNPKIIERYLEVARERAATVHKTRLTAEEELRLRTAMQQGPKSEYFRDNIDSLIALRSVPSRVDNPEFQCFYEEIGAAVIARAVNAYREAVVEESLIPSSLEVPDRLRKKKYDAERFLRGKMGHNVGVFCPGLSEYDMVSIVENENEKTRLAELLDLGFIYKTFPFEVYEAVKEYRHARMLSGNPLRKDDPRIEKVSKHSSPLSIDKVGEILGPTYAATVRRYRVNYQLKMYPTSKRPRSTKIKNEKEKKDV